MQHMFPFPSAWGRATILFASALLGLCLTGCGDKASHLQATVTSPLGRPGVCAPCNQAIARVTEENLITVGVLSTSSVTSNARPS